MQAEETIYSKNPYIQTLIALGFYIYHRVDDEQLTQIAGNLTYTLILGIVPAMATALAIFTRFPQFEVFQKTLEAYLMHGILPPAFSQTIQENVSHFASKAVSVSAISTLAMLFTTAMMFNLIETTFNKIWGVQEQRPMILRVVMYLFIAILGPVLLGGSLYLTSHVYLAGAGIVSFLPLPFLNGIWPFVFIICVLTGAFTLLYRYVPYRLVLWKDAVLGGLFASISFEIANRLFAIFIMQFASYQKIYGAIAIFPVFLLWLYVVSLVILFGALLTASLPDFKSGRWRRVVKPGNQYADALHVIHKLYTARSETQKRVGWEQLQERARLTNAELESMLLTMQELGWVRHFQRAARLIIRKRSKATVRPSLDDWIWIGNAEKITLGDVFAEFVFHPEADSLSTKINSIIQDNLNQSLASYFQESDQKEEMYEKKS